MSISVRSRRVVKMARLFFGVMAVTVFSALLVGCGKDDDNNPGGSQSGSGNLILGAGEAWVSVNTFCNTPPEDPPTPPPPNNPPSLPKSKSTLDEVCDSAMPGLIFQRNNDLVFIEYHDGQWGVTITAKWSTSGNNLTIEDSKGTYTISGDTLTISTIVFVGEDGKSEPITFTKRSGINPVYPKP